MTTIIFSGIKIECVCCGEDIENKCVGCNRNHMVCGECFENQVSSQISPDSIGEFINNEGKIICKFCPDKIPFGNKTIASNVSDEIYEKYMKIKEDISIKKTEELCEKRFREQKTKSKVEQHHNHICEEILTLHCPNSKCNQAILDFDGCFAIECSSCKTNFCGWCMGNFSPDAHAHVVHCSNSMNKGSVHGTFEQFTKTHVEKRTKKIIKYLKSIDDETEQADVIKSIEKNLLELGIKLNKSDIDNNDDKDTDNDKDKKTKSDMVDEKKIEYDNLDLYLPNIYNHEIHNIYRDYNAYRKYYNPIHNVGYKYNIRNTNLKKYDTSYDLPKSLTEITFQYNCW